MTRETEFTTAGFVILKVVKKDVKLSFFFKKKRENFFAAAKFCRHILAILSNLPLHLRRHLPLCRRELQGLKTYS